MHPIFEIDAGDRAECLSLDQRGYVRPVGLGCDVGSIETGAASDVIFVDAFE